MDVGKSLCEHSDFVLAATSQKPLDLTHLNATAAEDQEVERFQVFNLIFSTEKQIHKHYFSAPISSAHNGRKALAKADLCNLR